MQFFHIFGWKIWKMLIFIDETTHRMWIPPGRVIWAINDVDRCRVHQHSTVGLLAAILDAILDLTAFRYSDFGRIVVCYSPPQTVPETVKKPLQTIFRGSTLQSYKLAYCWVLMNPNSGHNLSEHIIFMWILFLSSPEAIHTNWKSKEVVSNCEGTSTAKELCTTGIVYLSMWLWLIQWTHSWTDWSKN